MPPLLLITRQFHCVAFFWFVRTPVKRGVSCACRATLAPRRSCQAHRHRPLLRSSARMRSVYRPTCSRHWWFRRRVRLSGIRWQDRCRSGVWQLSRGLFLIFSNHLPRIFLLSHRLSSCSNDSAWTANTGSPLPHVCSPGRSLIHLLV